ncbi:hypothetical protein [Streptomyces sp. NPDC056492]|uniref:hypothetical protein n=1 Tax=unclassified Streptomyces TaxID=2593676 RepID=UPI0036A0A569
MAEPYAKWEAGLGEPVPSDVDQLFRRPAGYLTGRRGRPVRVVRRDFPAGAGPVSGLWVDREDDDVIAVVKSTSEADAELEAAVRHVAARSHAVSDEEAEAEAERFGRLMGRRLRRHVEHDPEQPVLEGTPARIQASPGAADD